MCAWMKQNADDTKSEDPKGVEMVPAIAYCNYLDGKIINVKFRSVQQHPITGEWSKLFCQVSPTKPCAPYGIDSINLLRPDAQPIRQLIITEGEKDRLTLMTCGFPYVLSIANAPAPTSRRVTRLSTSGFSRRAKSSSAAIPTARAADW